MFLIIIGILFALIAFASFGQGNSAAGLGGLVVAALLVIIGVRRRNKRKAKHAIAAAEATAPMPQPAPEAAPKPAYSFIQMKVAGVTYANDDGTNRQDILRDIQRGKPPFDDRSNLHVVIQPTTFDGKNAYAILVNGVKIGNAPREIVPKLDVAVSKPDCTITDFQIVGGTDGLSYGVRMTVRYTA